MSVHWAHHLIPQCVSFYKVDKLVESTIQVESYTHELMHVKCLGQCLSIYVLAFIYMLKSFTFPVTTQIVHAWYGSLILPFNQIKCDYVLNLI